MLWLIITILAYLLFAFVTLGDRYLLLGPPNPKSYCFYVGLLGGLVLILIPFVGFSIPSYYDIIFCLVAGAMYILAILTMYEGLERYEVSRIIPAIGGFVPIFTLLITYFFFKESLSFINLIAFILLVLGSVIITYDPLKKVPFKSLKLSILAAILLSVAFVMSKYAYIRLDFWVGFIWIRIGVFTSSIFFLFNKGVRSDVFAKKAGFNLKTGIFFIFNQVLGAGAFILQNWGIALASLAFLPFINALQGLQYLFLFILTILMSVFLPKWSQKIGLKEIINKRIVLQKSFAIVLILIGLIILSYV
jgi:drug/metabolite transporter (DMT)-like permease